MPELPEVTTIITELIESGLVGRRFTGGSVLWERSIGGRSERDFFALVAGHTVLAVRRRGKKILIDLSRATAADGAPDRPDRTGRTGTITVHLRMSGRLYLCGPDTPRTGYERVILILDDHRELRFYDPRKFGRFLVSADPDEAVHHLGAEPLSEEFTPAGLYEIIRYRARRIKPLLLDQHVIAGLGNIYTDEALWLAQIHPERRASSLGLAEVTRLRDAIVQVLRQGIANGGTSLGNGKSNFRIPGSAGDIVPKNQEYLSVFQRTGLPCPRCGAMIDRIIVGQRATHICPRCQGAPG